MRFNIRLERNEQTGTWAAYVPAIEDLSAFAETRDSVLERIRRAIESYLESAEDIGLSTPRVDRSEWTELHVAV